MKIPRYWSKEKAEGWRPDGRVVSFSCWGWSEKSETEAKAQARRRAEEVLGRYLAGEKHGSYFYGEKPLREEIVEVLAPGRGGELAIVTRNRYGALVLNAARTMFLDIDFPEGEKRSGISGFVRRLFSRPAEREDRREKKALRQLVSNDLQKKKREDRREKKALRQLEQWAESHSRLGVRVYRTYAGLRCVITNETFDPRDGSAEALMQEVGCDPLYVRLCRQQECFRARLSPKPWRCGLDFPPARYPFDSPEKEALWRRWEERYSAGIEKFAVCRFLAHFGPSWPHPEVEPVLALHDRFCLKEPEFPLA